MFNKRKALVRKCAEDVNRLLLSTSTQKPIVRHLVLAGPAAMKRLIEKDQEALDKRLLDIMLPPVTCAYGGLQGLRDTLKELEDGILRESAFTSEKALLDGFFDRLSTDADLIAVGPHEVEQALLQGNASELFLHQGCRVHVRHQASGHTIAASSNSATAGFYGVFSTSSSSGTIPLAEWLADDRNCMGAKLHFIHGSSQPACQLLKAFDGITAVLRYPMDFLSNDFLQADDSFNSDCDLESDCSLADDY